jgi:hypothetical protein
LALFCNEIDMLYYPMGSSVDTVPIRSKDVVFRKIAGEFLLVPISRQAADVDSIYTLNEIGGRIWELIDGEKNIGEISDTIVEEFEVSPDVARADVREFLKNLGDIGAVKTG